MRLFLFFIISFNWLFANAHIFVYHRFNDTKHPSTNTSIAELKLQFEYLKNNHYKIVKLEEIVSKLESKQEIPSDWVAFTIDDAYKSFYTNGLPVFKSYRFPFTIFASTEVTQNKYPDFMSWNELQEASKYGSIEFHSHMHPRLTKLTDDEIIKDTKQGIELFKKYLNKNPTFYAYPFGEYDDRVQNILKLQFKFKAIFNQMPGAISKHSSQFDVFRFPLVGKSDIKFHLKYTNLENVEWIEPKNFPANSILKQVKVKIPKNIKSLRVFVSGENKWHDMKIDKDVAYINLNTKLSKQRTRIVVSPDYYQTSTKILVK